MYSTVDEAGEASAAAEEVTRALRGDSAEEGSGGPRWRRPAGVLAVLAAVALASAAAGVRLRCGGAGPCLSPAGGAEDASQEAQVDALVGLRGRTHHDVSLYCWAFTRGIGTEPKLLVTQMKHHWGIFACNQHVVLSSKTQVIHGMHIVGLGHNPTHRSKKDKDGNSYALNTGIFKKAWRHIIKVKNYADHDWTVKVDPDSVFFPAWLKRKLVHVRHDREVYLWNLAKSRAWANGQRLHGAIEVFSRPAVHRLAEDGMKHPGACLSKGTPTGEDGWIEYCLKVKLKVPGHFIHDLVHFHFADSDYSKCKGGAVAWHPMKTPHSVYKCHKMALAHGL